MKRYFLSFSPGERRIIIGSIASVVVISLLFWKGEEWLWNDNIATSNQEEVGSVIAQENDVRHRSKTTRVWYKARERQAVHNGDAIFSGKQSKSQVQLKDGGAIDLGENSLVVFDMLDKKKVADLRDGTFKLKIDGTVRIAIQGKMTTIEGKKSELQLTLGKDKKPKLKLISGEAQVKVKDKPQVKMVQAALVKPAKVQPPTTPVTTDTTSPVSNPPEPVIEETTATTATVTEGQELNELTFEEPAPANNMGTAEKVEAIATPEPDSTPMLAPVENETEKGNIANPAPTPTPELVVATAQEIAKLKKHEDVHYVWELYDLYEKREGQLVQKESAPLRVGMQHILEWEFSGPQKARAQIANTEDFKEPKNMEATNGKLTLEEVFVGENYWRVGVEPTWSVREKFTVSTEFLRGAAPQANVEKSEIPLLGPSAMAEIVLKSTVPTIGFVAQAATSSSFDPRSTRTFWTPNASFNLSFYHVGEFYYRFRAVSNEQKLSDWSKTTKFKVLIPEPPQAPVLTKGKNDGFIQEEFPIAWKSNASKVRIEYRDAKGEKIDEIHKSHGTWKTAIPGKYSVRAIATNAYGQESPPSISYNIVVKPVPTVDLKTANTTEKKEEDSKVKLEEKKAERKTAATESSSAMKKESNKTGKVTNEKYKTSQVSANGFLWTIQSSQQYYQSSATPVASGIGVHGMFWRGSHGLETSFKSGLIGFNSAGNQTTALKDLEARYHYRFYTGLPFKFSRELQISLFGGFETYRNTGGNFASKYDLIKFGTSLEFPVFEHWSTGGEFVYGAASDKSNKKEISGNLNYFFDSMWSFGMGYRIHFFEAGAISASPSGTMPYREGYTEGFSVLNYHY